MIIDDIKAIKSDRNEVRKFGILFSIILVLSGAYALYRNSYLYIVFFVSGGLLFVLSITSQFMMRPLQKLWMSFAIIIGWLVSHTIILAIFYLVLTPIGILLKIFRKKLLDLKINRSEESYWIPREKDEALQQNYFNQY